MHVLAIAALDFPLQHLFARLVAEIGIEKIARRPRQGIKLGDAGEGRAQPIQGIHLGIGKAALLPGRVAGGMDLAIDEIQRLGDIVGHALVPQIFQYGIIDRAIGIREPPPDRLAVAKYPVDGILQVKVRLHHFVAGFANLDLGPAFAPEKPAPSDVGVQGGDEHGGAIDGQPAGGQPLAQLQQYVLRRMDGFGAIHQPVEHRLNIR